MATNNANVWCTDVLMNTRIVKPVNVEGELPTTYDHWYFRYQAGERVEPDELPDTLLYESGPKKLPEVFQATGRVLVVGRRVKEVLEKFRLGRTHLHEVTISRGHYYEPYAEPFYIVNIAEHRPVVVLEQSIDIKMRDNGVMRISSARTNPFDRIFVRPEAPDDVDLWFHPNVRDLPFLSARLAAAIKAAKIRNFRLFPCREAD